MAETMELPGRHMDCDDPQQAAAPEAAGAGQSSSDTHACDARPGVEPNDAAGQCAPDDHLARAGSGGGGGQVSSDNHTGTAAALATLRCLHRQRVFAIGQRMRLDNGLGALLRTNLGWSLALPAKERAKIAARARALVKAVADPESDHPNVALADVEAWRAVILAALAARMPFNLIQKDAEKAMTVLVKSLAVWGGWGEGVKGLGPVSLAGLLAETGDPGGYATVSRLWKRMGLAVIAGNAQGRPGAKASKADWIAHAYSKRRRSIMWNIGQNLIRCGGDYYLGYLRLKVAEVAAAREDGLEVAPAAKIPKAEVEFFRSEGHVHNRAQRRLEKRFLRDLWVAWRAAMTHLEPNRCVPPADPSPAKTEVAG